MRSTISSILSTQNPPGERKGHRFIPLPVIVAASVLLVLCIFGTGWPTIGSAVEPGASPGIFGRPPDEETYRAARRAMVENQLRRRNIHDQRVLRAMEKVPRHLFVPEPSLEAYDDYPLPIGHGQTISQPYIVALMTQALALGPQDRVLEVGTGSAYQAAVLAELVAEVYTIEIVSPLARRAARTLRDLGYENVRVKEGDGFFGWPDAAPFDAMIITAATPRIPPPLVDQLKDGGRMILPLGESLRYQTLTLVTRKGDGLETRSLSDVRFVPMTGKTRETK